MEARERVSKALPLWLSIALAVHFAAKALAHVARLPDTASPYLTVAFYSVPAAFGLYRAGTLGRGKATMFCGLVVAAHALALYVAILLTLGTGQAPLSGDALQAGAAGGLIGSALSLAGLGLLKGSWDERTTLVVGGFTVLLTVLGAGLMAAFGAHPEVPLEWYYLAWQMPFSLALLLISTIKRS